MMEAVDESYDVVVIGGSLAGASVAILLLRDHPNLRILIVERSTNFGRRVGESTVEVSSYFLTKVLGLASYLGEAQLGKQAMRFWFANRDTETIADASEMGSVYQTRLPTFQVDRSTLDEEVLRRAGAAGASILRDVAVQKVELHAGGTQCLTLRMGSEQRSVRARWVVDASGQAGLLARQNGWLEPNDRHPTTAVWARWSGVKDLDGEDLARRFPKWATATYTTRNTATNHLLGDGWWAWIIPLKGGDVSIGVVFDERRVSWPVVGSGDGARLGDALHAFLSAHPVGKELLEGARWNPGDVHIRRHLPYSSRVVAGDGFVLVSDAAAFIDPLYSPGMDWLTYTVSGMTNLIHRALCGESIQDRIDALNQALPTSVRRWFEAVYQDKYDYIGDYELMRIAFELDLGMYFLGVAAQPYRDGVERLLDPVFSRPESIPFYHFMRFYNRRLAKLGRLRRVRGEFGRRNSHQRALLPGFSFSRKGIFGFIRPVLKWWALELQVGWQCWGQEPEPVRAAAMAPKALPALA